MWNKNNSKLLTILTMEVTSIKLNLKEINDKLDYIKSMEKKLNLLCDNFIGNDRYLKCIQERGDKKNHGN